MNILLTGEKTINADSPQSRLASTGGRGLGFGFLFHDLGQLLAFVVTITVCSVSPQVFAKVHRTGGNPGRRLAGEEAPIYNRIDIQMSPSDWEKLSGTPAKVTIDHSAAEHSGAANSGADSSSAILGGGIQSGDSSDQPVLTINDDSQQIPISIASRGQMSIKYPRKNFRIKIKKSAGKESHRQKVNLAGLVGDEFLLTAGPEDVLNVHSMVGYRLLAAAGISHLDFRLTELFINNESEGLYLISNDPTDIVLQFGKKNKSAESGLVAEESKTEFVFRRRYADFLKAATRLARLHLRFALQKLQKQRRRF